MPYRPNGSHDNCCYFCGRDIPKYEHGGVVIATGFVPPSPPRTVSGELSPEESRHVTYKQGPNGITVTAKEERCCRGCWLIEFRKLHPGAPDPKLPRPIDDEELVRELLAGNIVTEHQLRARGVVTAAEPDGSVVDETTGTGQG